MSVEVPERIWVYKPERINKIGEIVSELLPVANSPEDYGEIEYVRADKLEELAAKASEWEERFWKRDAQADRLMQERDKAEAALAEAKRENEALREDRDFLQEILDTRPAINAALPESYIRWSQSLYSGEAVRAWMSARNAGGKDV